MKLHKSSRFFLILSIFCFISSSTLSQKTIKGIVLDSETNEPLIGATILIKETTFGTLTDLDGKFELAIPQMNNPVLIISYISYSKQEIEITDQEELNILMNASVMNCCECLIVDHRRAKSFVCDGILIQSFGTKFNPGISTNPLQLIQGNIRLADINSFDRASPFYVVDGVPLDFAGQSIGAENPLNYLAPEEIASISVMKGLKAATLYGSRAARGAIVIETQKNVSCTPARFSFTNKVGALQTNKENTFIQQHQLNFEHENSKTQLRTGLMVQDLFNNPSDGRWQNYGYHLYTTTSTLDNHIQSSIRFHSNYLRNYPIPEPLAESLPLDEDDQMNHFNYRLHSSTQAEMTNWLSAQLNLSSLRHQNIPLRALNSNRIEIHLSSSNYINDIRIDAQIGYERQQQKAEKLKAFRQEAFSASTSLEIGNRLDAEANVRHEQNKISGTSSAIPVTAISVNSSYRFPEINVDIACAFARADIEAGLAAGVFNSPIMNIREWQFATSMDFGRMLTIDASYTFAKTTILDENFISSAIANIYFPTLYDQLERQGLHIDLYSKLISRGLDWDVSAGYSAANGIAAQQYHIRTNLEWNRFALDSRMEAIKGWKLSAENGDFLRLAHTEVSYSLPGRRLAGLNNVKLFLIGQNLFTSGEKSVFQNQREWMQVVDPMQYSFPIIKTVLLGLSVNI